MEASMTSAILSGFSDIITFSLFSPGFNNLFSRLPRNVPVIASHSRREGVAISHIGLSQQLRLTRTLTLPRNDNVLRAFTSLFLFVCFTLGFSCLGFLDVLSALAAHLDLLFY